MTEALASLQKLHNLIDCTPLDEFIRESNPDEIGISNEIDAIAKRHSISLLIKGDIPGYEKFLQDFADLKIIDHRPLLGGSLFSDLQKAIPTTHSLWSYLNNFKKDSFRRQYEMSEYLRNEFNRSGALFKEEFDTGHGKCDFLIRGGDPLLLELKPAKIIRKDIYQCVEFRKYQRGYPVVVLGNGIDKVSEDLAKEHGINVYTYRLKTVAPTLMEIKRHVGDRYPALEMDLHQQFLGECAPIALALGWCP